MLENTADSRIQGFAVSMLFSCATLGGLVFDTMLGMLQVSLGATSNPTLYGLTLAGSISISYLASLPFYFLAGRAYKQEMEEREGNFTETE